MKPIFVFAFCLGVAVSLVQAEPQKEGKQKREGGGGQGKHAQRAGGGQGGKHRNLNGLGTGGAAHLNAVHQGRGKAAGRAQFREFSGEGQANLPAVQAQGRSGARAQARHFDLADARRTNIEAVTFRRNARITGASNWKGERYVVFRNYRPAWHDRGWWTAHYPRIVLIGGGWYYWNSGFWYPAWGYDPGQAFYAYDGPIYAYNDLPPDQVVANVQEVLQNQGYYQGEIDGMLGPLTRAALADYQRDHGLYTTSAIDEPTMASLGFDSGEPQSG
jgi:Putative peptidoglycan binding domain